MKIDFYQVDSFTGQIFKGNPAGVCPLQSWLSDAVMQDIAAENNLSETAFFVPDDTGVADYHLRWFTPTDEVDLCGHATLATAYVVFNHLDRNVETVSFASQSGILTVRKLSNGMIELDFPTWQYTEHQPDGGVDRALGVTSKALLKGPDWAVVIDDPERVEHLQPDFAALKNLAARCVIVTAKSNQDGTDFVSRVFCPKIGIDEDPVTGSAHCLLTPYWNSQTGQTSFAARQVSKRGGSLQCTLSEDGARVRIAGKAALYLQGRIELVP